MSQGQIGVATVVQAQAVLRTDVRLKAVNRSRKEGGKGGDRPDRLDPPHPGKLGHKAQAQTPF